MDVAILDDHHEVALVTPTVERWAEQARELAVGSWTRRVVSDPGEVGSRAQV
jgi:hypothetical protein